jgi:hypothetical protein
VYDLGHDGTRLDNHCAREISNHDMGHSCIIVPLTVSVNVR